MRLREAEQKNLQPQTKKPNGFFWEGRGGKKGEGENELNKWFHLSEQVMYSCSGKVQIKRLKHYRPLASAKKEEENGGGEKLGIGVIDLMHV